MGERERREAELQALSGELDSVRGFAESLRSQAHESANRLHAVVSLIELGRPEEAVQFATRELELAQQLTDKARYASAVLARQGGVGVPTTRPYDGRRPDDQAVRAFTWVQWTGLALIVLGAALDLAFVGGAFGWWRKSLDTPMLAMMPILFGWIMISELFTSSSFSTCLSTHRQARVY